MVKKEKFYWRHFKPSLITWVMFILLFFALPNVFIDIQVCTTSLYENDMQLDRCKYRNGLMGLASSTTQGFTFDNFAGARMFVDQFEFADYAGTYWTTAYTVSWLYTLLVAFVASLFVSPLLFRHKGDAPFLP